MESITKNWNTDLNYWELNPIIKTIKVFKSLFEKDKSKDKKDSSKLMWAIALVSDPNEDNPWRTVNVEEKKKIIAEDFLEDKKFNWEKKEIVELLDTYYTFCLSVSEQELLVYEEKLRQRGKFIKDTDYSLDYYEENDKGKITLKRGTADQLDKMVLNTGKLITQIQEIRESISREALQGSLKGGASESASEEGLL